MPTTFIWIDVLILFRRVPIAAVVVAVLLHSIRVLVFCAKIGRRSRYSDSRLPTDSICNTFVLLRIGWHYIILSISYSRNVRCNTLYSLVFRLLLALLHTRHLSGLVCHNRVARDCSHSLSVWWLGRKSWDISHLSFLKIKCDTQFRGDILCAEKKNRNRLVSPFCISSSETWSE